MCGRYTYLFKWKQLHRLMELLSWPVEELSPRYNVAPTQPAPVVRLGEGGRIGAMLRWGLVPSWADDPSIGGRMINARAETAAQKPAFRSAFARRRCLVPISGFYEWRAVEGRKAKQPYWIGRADREPFALAGLWERWEKRGEPVETFTILTTAANDLLRPIHDRMPAVVERDDYGVWLGERDADPAALTSLLDSRPWEGFEAVAIGTRVNSPRNDDPAVLEPLDGDAPPLFG
ncbi:MAG: SOS response-associated peptidase [Phycisphaerales bacterium]|nr:SOS response-associated peptidase [Phycisphaerales bacterium]